ncbi:hypothetical protein WJX72_000217 [[Myrmecia] bisecta]|uniref:Uncharacterized protein n=1 Tax=[Myrmecia] bisecta TaxID=41462 RepID=A0AAW1P8S9_9CHLO
MSSVEFRSSAESYLVHVIGLNRLTEELEVKRYENSNISAAAQDGAAKGVTSEVAAGEETRGNRDSHMCRLGPCFASGVACASIL